MKIEDVLNRIDQSEDEEQKIKPVIEYLNDRGFRNIKTKELDLLFDKYGYRIYLNGLQIVEIYSIASRRENSRSMNWLTFAIFLFTAVTTGATVYSLF